MSHKGKYIDRYSDIRYAGNYNKSIETVGDALKMYSPEEVAFNITSLMCKKQHEVQENASLGYSQFLPTESLKDVLSPESKKSRFIAFKEKFSEDMFFKKTGLGKPLALKSKPAEFTNENFIYGLRTHTTERAYDLIAPNKTPHEVKQQFLKGHDKYLISHKDYFPSERIERNYNENFKPNAIYGISKNGDKTGQMVKKCLQQNDRMVAINKAQKKFLNRTTGQLGKKIDRYNLNMDPHQTFGKQAKSQNSFDVRALIENVEPSAKKVEIIEAISHINKLRRILFNRSDFHMYDLKILLNKYDGNKTGFITFNSIMKTLHSLQIHANEHKIRAAITHFLMLKDENETTELVNTEEFWKMLHIQYPLPQKFITTELIENSENKQTTYRFLCWDREKPIALQHISSKLKYEDRTTAADLLSPDIPMHYGLSPNDFKVLRSKEELSRIFKHVLSENFDQIWQLAWPEKCNDPSCKMSVNELRTVIDEYNNNQHLK